MKTFSQQLEDCDNSQHTYRAIASGITGSVIVSCLSYYIYGDHATDSEADKNNKTKCKSKKDSSDKKPK